MLVHPMLSQTIGKLSIGGLSADAVWQVYGLGCSAGPSAVLAALVASGIACDTFQFVGFLHAKQGQRQKQLKQLAGSHSIYFAGPSLLAFHTYAQS